ncbi:hypothetical protein EVAR_56886_1 [Eumeta japonica]|uniref:Uncharacterized protein n=1 Tax=Eumeta variegata TaxID=151549 RepID=A0A4C1Z836_EUMVA|nr:hypothetical protein EVAR_56886_1 [Eumeta japonica]
MKNVLNLSGRQFMRTLFTLGYSFSSINVLEDKDGSGAAVTRHEVHLINRFLQITFTRHPRMRYAIRKPWISHCSARDTRCRGIQSSELHISIFRWHRVTDTQITEKRRPSPAPIVDIGRSVESKNVQIEICRNKTIRKRCRRHDVGQQQYVTNNRRRIF